MFLLIHRYKLSSATCRSSSSRPQWPIMCFAFFFFWCIFCLKRNYIKESAPRGVCGRPVTISPVIDLSSATTTEEQADHLFFLPSFVGGDFHPQWQGEWSHCINWKSIILLVLLFHIPICVSQSDCLWRWSPRGYTCLVIGGWEDTQRNQ